MVSGVTVLKAAAVVVGLLVVSGGALGAYALSGGFEEPAVEDVDVRWGEITTDTSEIRATIVVDNPNAIGIPGVIDIEYTASLNGIAIADGVKEDVGLSTGRSEIELVIPIDNQQLPPWWVTHINGGEESTLSIEATVSGPMGVSFDLPPQQQAFEMALLDAMRSEGGKEVTMFGQPVLSLGETTAEWGEATPEETPLVVTTQVTNEHSEPVELTDVSYVIEMNGLVMGQGEGLPGLTLEPGETDSLELNAVIDTTLIDEWWVSHLENDEETTLSVELTVTVESGDQRETVTIDFLGGGETVSTDILGGA
jgi:LEA14-like dessication related protein